MTQAAAAAVLRGQLDTQSAANGSHLLGGASQEWRTVVPTPGDTPPEAWVVQWSGITPANAVGATQAGGARSLAKDTGGLVRLGSSTRLQTDQVGALIELHGRVPLRQGLALFTTLDTGNQRVSFPKPLLTNIEGTGETAMTGMREQATRVKLGAALSGTLARGDTLLVMPSLVSSTHAASLDTFNQATAAGFIVGPAAFGVGAGLGAIGLHPLRANGPLAFRWEAQGSAEANRHVANYFSSKRANLSRKEGSFNDDDTLAYDPLVTLGSVQGGLRWRSPYTGLMLQGSVRGYFGDLGGIGGDLSAGYTF